MEELEAIYGLSQEGLGATHCTFVVEGGAVDDWDVRALRSCHESLSALYSYSVVLSARDAAPPDPDLLGRSATLGWGRSGGTERAVQGIIDRVEQGDGTDLAPLWTVRIVPALAASEHRTDSRIFSGKSAIEVAVQVLKDDLACYDRSVELRLDPASYPTRNYVVQYRESNLAFVRRLLAEEGVWFTFEHPPEPLAPERLILGDANADFDPFLDEPLLLAVDAAHAPEQEFLSSMLRAAELGPSKLAVRQFNWGHPDVHDEAEHSGGRDAGALALYEHGDVPTEAGDTPTHTPTHQARRRLEAVVARQRRVHVTTNYCALRAGSTFTIEGHPDPALDGAYVVLRASHRYGSEGGDAAATARRGEYQNHALAQPLDVPYRPLRLPKPRIHGVQTATVVSGQGATASGSDLSTDAFGRVRVKFPWDRTDANARGTTSCWARVAQLWSGAGWGSQFIPRSGMEVVVSFVDGDPDQPLVVGTVYNGRHGLPFESASQSGFLTSSMPDASGYNQLMFEDAAGEEQIYLHAQRDYALDVKNNRTTHVFNDEIHFVDQDRVRQVGRDECVTVKRNAFTEIGQDCTEHVAGKRRVTVTCASDETFGSLSVDVRSIKSEKVSAASTEQVGGAKTVNVKGALEMAAGAAVTINAGGAMTASCKGGYTERVGGSKNISSKGYKATSSTTLDLESKQDLTAKTGKKLKLESKDDLIVTGDKQGSLTLKKQLTIKVGKASITLKSNGDILISGNKIQLKGKSDVKIKGSKSALQ